MTIPRSISAALACALALAVACSIADDRMEWKVCSNGNLCPIDTACSEDGLRCLSCGNGIPEPGEECDDGDQLDGDGCDHNCTPTACGNGIITAGEACDDGNTRDGDECSSDCLNVCPAKRCYDRPAGAIKRVPEKLPDPCEGDPDC